MMSREQPLVSVIIPCYNVGTFVEKAIQSILRQTYTNLEIWIVDDASTDDTIQKIKAFKDDRIKVLEYKTNTKKIGAVNEVLQKVKGDYIAFQDADDWSESSRIEKQLKMFAEDAELGICFTNYVYEGDKKGSEEKIALSDEQLRDEFHHFLRKKNADFGATSCPSMMISKSALIKTSGYNPYFEGRVAEDIQWVYRILKYYKGITVNEYLYHYTVRKNSLTGIQYEGINAKAAYSWKLLSKIIYKDIHENIDVLATKYKDELKQLELKACEETLVDNIRLLNETRKAYENSRSFKIGKFMLTPFRLLTAINRRSRN